jgi:hypothetical protein
MSADANATPVDAPETAPTELAATATWPLRPDAGALNKSIPLFFISRDSDGFWIACEADLRIGGIFLCQRSALRFARRCAGPAGCATMILSEPHDLDTENRGNRFAVQLRPVKRRLRHLGSRLNTLVGKTIVNARASGARLSHTFIEQRLHRAGIETELYRGRYQHSSKNDDDLPVVR